jgi:DNA (cytosine-5)-methyltransferase 1
MAGFPCPAFSIAGISKMKSLKQCIALENEEKGKLFFEIIRILDAKKPKVFLLENVRTLEGVQNGKAFQIIKDSLRKLGYGISWEVLDARDFGLPQKRKRIFIVGFRDDLIFKFPKGNRDNKPKIKEILEEKILDKYTITDTTWKRLLEYKKKHKLRGHGFGYQLIEPDGDAFTLVAHYGKDPHTNLYPQDGKNPRRLTPRECARIMGFPDDFKIHSVDGHAWRELGNSVPVPVVVAILEQIAESLKNGKKKVRITDFFR